MTKDATDHRINHRKPLRGVLVDPSHTDLIIGKNVLEATGRINIVAESTSHSLAFSLIERNSPTHVFLGIGEDSNQAFETISMIRRKCPTLAIVAMATHPDADDILRSFRAGADEFLMKPLQPEQLTSALRELQTRKSYCEHNDNTRGKIIPFWGSSGGCGTTTLACNAAFTLAKLAPTILVDLHFDQGDLFIHLDLHPKVSLRDIGDPPDQIDETLIESITTTHSSGLRVLLQPQDVHPSRLSHHTIERILEILERKYTYVILDIGHDIQVAETLVGFASAFCLVLVQTLPSLFLASQRVQLLKEFGYNPKRINVIANKYLKTSRVGSERIRKALQVDRLFTIRSDEKRVHASINRGVPLARISRMGKATKDVSRLVSQIQNVDPLLEIPVNEESVIPQHAAGSDAVFHDVDAYAARR